MRQRLSDPATVFAWVGARFAGTPVAPLFALDRQLGDIVRTTAQPIIGQMRLTWWHEALTKLDAASPPAQPLLTAIAAEVLPAGVTGAALARMIEGWELLLDPDVSDGELATYGEARGGLFTAAAKVSGGRVANAEAGAGWGLADLATNVADPALADRAAALAEVRLHDGLVSRWREARPLAALARDAAMALAGRGEAGGPARAAAALKVRLTGR